MHSHRLTKIVQVSELDLVAWAYVLYLEGQYKICILGKCDSTRKLFQMLILLFFMALASNPLCILGAFYSMIPLMPITKGTNTNTYKSSLGLANNNKYVTEQNKLKQYVYKKSLGPPTSKMPPWQPPKQRSRKRLRENNMQGWRWTRNILILVKRWIQ